MKKSITLVIYLLISSLNYIYSQNSASIAYKAPGIYLLVTNKKGVEEFRKPMGRDVDIFCDTFFKSYSIYYTNESGLTEPFYLKHLADEKNEFNVTQYKMEDKFGTIYHVLNLLAQIGQLKILLSKEYPEGRIAWFVIDGAKQTTR